VDSDNHDAERKNSLSISHTGSGHAQNSDTHIIDITSDVHFAFLFDMLWRGPKKSWKEGTLSRYELAFSDTRTDSADVLDFTSTAVGLWRGEVLRRRRARLNSSSGFEAGDGGFEAGDGSSEPSSGSSAGSDSDSSSSSDNGDPEHSEQESAASERSVDKHSEQESAASERSNDYDTDNNDNADSINGADNNEDVEDIEDGINENVEDIEDGINEDVEDIGNNSEPKVEDVAENTNSLNDSEIARNHSEHTRNLVGERSLKRRKTHVPAGAAVRFC
jgi:hypothetical protein